MIEQSQPDPGAPLYYHYDGDSIVDYYSQAGVLQYYFINGPGTDETLFQGGGSSNWNFLTDGLGSHPLPPARARCSTRLPMTRSAARRSPPPSGRATPARCATGNPTSPTTRPATTTPPWEGS